MEKINGSLVTQFILVGLSEDPNVQKVLFIVFFCTYLFTFFSNSALVTVCIREPRLHTPMYFFLVNLSILDICFSTAIVPNMLFQLLVSQRISFSRCATQMFMFLALAGTECVLLGVMAYDRYVAILFPLRYTIIMSKTIYVALAAGAFLSGVVIALIDSVFTLRLTFCGPNIINHFFCEVGSLIRLACGDTHITELVIIIIGIFALLIPSSFTLISYVSIINTIIRIRSSQAQQKAFSTCASHLTVVTIFYSTAIFMYMKPVSKDTANMDKMISVFYTITPPLINPLIYSLRNKDVKLALQRTLKRNALH